MLRKLPVNMHVGECCYEVWLLGTADGVLGCCSQRKYMPSAAAACSGVHVPPV